ncbi:MAG: LacI family transcriptional regulator [Treponema sp.]|jgi:LacI family transcriptional regulator|nr:LacI family transcriptional regulator [Treponema sp.]
MVTLKDIADEAGVSTATVSHVVNGNTSKVSRENALRIRKIIQKRQYVPNSSARTLAAKSSHIIAGILIGGAGDNLLKDPYNAEFFGEMVWAVQDHGYYLMIRYVNSYEEVVRSLRSWNIDGAVFVGTSDRDIRKIQQGIQIPLIFTDSYTDLKKISNVGINDFQGGVLAAEHFLQKGHTKLGFVGYSTGEQGKNVVAERFNGFQSALARHAIELDTKRCFYVTDGDPREDIQRVADVLAAGKDTVSGVFVSADKLAVALLEALAERSIGVPEDISIIGYDDLPITSNAIPTLTTIRQDISQKARIAIDLLFRQIEEKDKSPENITLDVTLVERDSVLQKS